ncbi:anti-sigma B factor antagonist [Palleronia marisminoris]|uniref:Anti-sigma factor antagonist n=1 Tax=Palleronia marisminoris TaxID=315423 RepID=A0A1Y5SM52_9RHOB|nr:STAS domain-containing protein [Palleronia marisminoris]SFG86490.1 anti-sigma B factor antagonist [Palleronia marisminoris]SLN42788.1 Putative anti-sigma factor antagonist [Palleronia marisminoris]
MNIETRLSDEGLVVRPLESRLDAAGAVQFKDAIRDLVSSAPDCMILDLGNVTFLDSSGLGAVVGAMKMLGPDRRLELANLNPAVAKVFALTRMDRVFTIHTTPPAGAPVDTRHVG